MKTSSSPSRTASRRSRSTARNSANKLRFQTARELLDAFRDGPRDPDDRRRRSSPAPATSSSASAASTRSSTSLDYSSVMPVIDLYEFIDTMPKPVIAAVNGFAVGGGNVLQVVCDLTIAAEHAVFRQVGPMVGSFDAGYGTWYLEETIGRRRAKEMWYLNRKYTAEQALEMGLVNEIADDPRRAGRASRPDAAPAGPVRPGALKTAFSGRHTGVAGQARLAHDLLLTAYRSTAGGRGDVGSPSRSAASPTGAGSTGELRSAGTSSSSSRWSTRSPASAAEGRRRCRTRGPSRGVQVCHPGAGHCGRGRTPCSG